MLHLLLDIAVVHAISCELVGDPRGYDGAFSALDEVGRNHVGNLGVLELGIGGEIVQGVIHGGLTSQAFLEGFFKGKFHLLFLGLSLWHALS